MANFVINKSPVKDLMRSEIISKKNGIGFFAKVFCIDEFEENCKLKKNIIQINRPLLKIGGIIRRCDFDINPYEETKVVLCCKSFLFDVGIDLIKESFNFLQYFVQILTSEKNVWAFLLRISIILKNNS